MTSALEQRAILSGWALVPFVAVCFILAGFLYNRHKKPLTESVGMDAALWGSAAVVFFGITFGMMQVKLPGAPSRKSSAAKSS